MDIRKQLREARGLTPTEAQLARTVLAMGERIQQTSIKELASASATSIATIHRLCKKLGLEGFKELKVELARAAARKVTDEDVDFDFPFDAGWGPERVTRSMKSLYAEAIEETLEVLNPRELARAADLVRGAEVVDVYTQSHNLYPAQMLCDRLLSAGRPTTCHEGFERQVCNAPLSDAGHAAVMISYSGVSELFDKIYASGMPS